MHLTEEMQERLETIDEIKRGFNSWYARYKHLPKHIRTGITGLIDTLNEGINQTPDVVEMAIEFAWIQMLDKVNGIKIEDSAECYALLNETVGADNWKLDHLDGEPIIRANVLNGEEILKYGDELGVTGVMKLKRNWK